MAEIALKEKKAAVFPSAAVEEALRAGLLISVTSMAEMHEVALPPTPTAKCAVTIHIDSLGVVDLLCEVEPIVGFELKDSIVKSGGYFSINEAIAHVMPRIEAAWRKHASKASKGATI